jgi:nicotinate phosphoribosyltransferase
MHTANWDKIKSGQVTDVYFRRAVEILKAKNIHKHVTAEVRCPRFPADYDYAVLAGIEEAAYLLEGLDVDVWAMDEGTVFQPGEPVMFISGDYMDFAVYETPLLGFLCQASGIATKAARCKMAAGERTVLSFGARRMHPAIAPMIDRSAYIGGCDGVSVIESAELLGEEPTGTIPHAFILVVGDPVEAFRMFDEVVDESVRRIALVDTFSDEKFEALNAAEALGERLFAVRLDTPSSRRGNFKEIFKEVRWELDLRGHQHVKLVASGGIDEYSMPELNEVVDAYGVGTSISNAPVIDFSMDIVEIEGEPIAKRGKMSGIKRVLKCKECSARRVVPGKPGVNANRNSPVLCMCGGEMTDLLKPLIREGKITRDLPGSQDIRSYILEQLLHRPIDL